jgi:hypothetical protein
MATFNPDQSLLPSVGGSITPMSGGGDQKGGKKQADGSYLLLEANQAKYTSSKSMMKGLAKMAPKYFKNKADIPTIKATIDSLFEFGNAFDTNELKIKNEIVNFVSKIPSKKKNIFIDPEKKGSIENTSESQSKVMKYIASRKVDIDKMTMTLDENTLVIKYQILPLSTPGTTTATPAPAPAPAPTPAPGVPAPAPAPGVPAPGPAPAPAPKPSTKPIVDDKKTKIQIVISNKLAYGSPPNYEGSGRLAHVMPTAKITPKPFTPVKGSNTIYIMVNSVNDAIEELHKIYPSHDIDVLNFANKNHVGGGVEEGAPAQEEELCRTSPALYNSLLLYATPESIGSWTQGQRYAYPKQEWTDFLLYTPNVPIIRHDAQYKYNKLDPAITVSVITAAADDNQKTNNTFRVNNASEELKTGFRTLISSISKAYITAKTDSEVTWKTFDTTSKTITNAKPLMNSNKKRILLLGPWGCGAFAPLDKTARNEYRIFVATQFCEVLKQTDLKVYDRIIFTFYEPVKGKEDLNLKTFVSVFKGKKCFENKLEPIGSKLTVGEGTALWEKLKGS